MWIKTKLMRKNKIKKMVLILKYVTLKGYTKKKQTKYITL